MYHKENSAVTAFGSELLRRTEKSVDGLENNNSFLTYVTYQFSSE